MHRRFTHSAKRKTWELETRGAEQLIRKSGSLGMQNYASSFKTFKSAAACAADSEKRIAKQSVGGFAEVDAPTWPPFVLDIYANKSNDVFRVRDAVADGLTLSDVCLRQFASGSPDVVIDALSKGIAAPSGLLTSAALTGQLRLVRSLLAGGVDVDERLEGESTALMLAAQKNKKRVVAALIEAGADLEARETSGATPLWHALAGLHPAAIHQLLTAGADAHHAKHDGSTLLDRALEILVAASGTKRERIIEIVHILLKAGVSGNANTLRTLGREDISVTAD